MLFLGVVNVLFERVEICYGWVLVCYVFVYIIVVKSGLIGIEIEDLLLCDDYVLDDVY